MTFSPAHCSLVGRKVPGAGAGCVWAPRESSLPKKCLRVVAPAAKAPIAMARATSAASCMRRERRGTRRRASGGGSSGSELMGGFQHVTDAVHRADADARRLELGAQPRDIGLDRVRRDRLAAAPNVLADAFLCDDAPGLPDLPFPHYPFPWHEPKEPAAYSC